MLAEKEKSVRRTKQRLTASLKTSKKKVDEAERLFQKRSVQRSGKYFAKSRCNQKRKKSESFHKNRMTPSKVEKKTETKSPEVKKKSVSISASKTVTGKGGRDIKLPGTPMGGKKLANVTREQLEKLGLDPSKKSSLTKYLNAFDRLGKRPTKKSDLVAGKMMGGMMKKKGNAMGGMMKSKGMAKGGAMKKKGYAMGGSAKKFPDLSGDA